MAVCGFDFGTQSLLVAVAQNRGIDVLANEASNRQTPAVISFGDSERCIGESGAVKRARNLKNSVWNVKRLIGKTWEDSEFQKERQALYCQFVKQGDDNVSDVGIKVRHGGENRVFSPTQVAGMLLGKMSDVVENERKQKPGFSVVAVPSFFTERERQEVLAAAEIAGIRCLGVMSESAAIAIGYGIYKEWPKAEADATLVAFVDFGASSFTVSIVSFCEEGLRVLSTGYDRTLGGRDFDQALFEFARTQIQTKHRIDVSENQRAAARLLASCESAKKTLSTCPDANIFLENLDEDLDFNLPITRDEFERICEPIFARLEQPIREAIEGASARRQALFKDAAPITPSSLHSVEVVGGSWRIPKVTRILSEFFGREMSKTLNSEEAVVRGAAVRCAQLCPVFKVRDFKVRDATPYSIETLIASEAPKTSFPKNQSVPCTTQNSVLLEPSQTSLDVSFRYVANSGIPEGGPNVLSAYHISSIPASEIEGQKTKVIVKTGLDRSGLLLCSATAEVPVPIPVAEPTPAASSSTPSDSSSSDSSSSSSSSSSDSSAQQQQPETTSTETPSPSASPAPGGENGPVSDDPTPASSSAPTHKVKRVTLECVAQPLCTSLGQIQAWIGIEQKLRASDRLIIETAEARNNLESYIFSLRRNLNSAYSAFASEAEKEDILPLLDTLENWLYDEGDGCAKAEYDTRIANIKAKGEPIATRAREDEERGPAVIDLRTTINWWRNQIQTTDAKYEHITAEDRAQIETYCNEAETWLNEQLAAQAARETFANPVLLVVDIRQRNSNLASSAATIMNKPKPKVEVPPPAATPTTNPEPAAAATEGAEKTSDDPPASTENNNTSTTDDLPEAPTDDNTSQPVTDDVLD